VNVFAAKNPARSADRELTGRVRGALHAHFGTTAKEIDVLVRDGFVFLYGAVPTESLRVRAERVAAAVPGSARSRQRARGRLAQLNPDRALYTRAYSRRRS